MAPGGSKQWVWRGTIRGRRRDIGLGAVAYTTLAEARDIAYHYRKLARAGRDPTSDAARNSTAPTFAEASEKRHRGPPRRLEGRRPFRGQLAILAAALRLLPNRLHAGR